MPDTVFAGSNSYQVLRVTGSGVRCPKCDPCTSLPPLAIGQPIGFGRYLPSSAGQSPTKATLPPFPSFFFIFIFLCVLFFFAASSSSDLGFLPHIALSLSLNECIHPRLECTEQNRTDRGARDLQKSCEFAFFYFLVN